MNLEALKFIIAEYQELRPKNLIVRQTDIRVDLNKIITIVGPRRSGKTYILYQLINQLLNKGMQKHKILFLNFEDERLEGVEADQILWAYREMYPDTALEDVAFFFDEIQALKNWHKFVFRLYEQYKPKIFLTGSNSKLLSQEIATQLRGRTLTFEIYPLSFTEFLKFKNIPSEFYSPAVRAKINNAFDESLTFGGFPEVVLIDKDLKINLLQNYFQTIFFKDIIERYQVKNIFALKFFIKRIIRNLGKPTSVHKLYNELKSANIKISKDTLYDFLEYCQSVFLLRSLPKLSLSETKRLTSQNKFFIIDNGLAYALTPDYSTNKGVLLENLVYKELKNRGFDLFYYRNDAEIDFVAIKKSVVYLIQVAYTLEDKTTLSRELKAFAEAKKFFPQAIPIIITRDQTSFLQDVKAVNIIDFLVGNNKGNN